MTTITLKSLQICNFKGVREFKAEFNPLTESNISGDNRQGKTTTADAFNWLLVGKNSHDEKDFEIKNTVDKSLNKNDHSVTAVFCVDGLDMKLSRTYREKWVKKRGFDVAELSGHETLFMYNDIPVSQSEFKQKVESMIDEKILKLITSPTYFNSLKWDEQRAILSKMAGEISNESIAGDSVEFIELLNQLSGESLVDFKKKLTAQKKKIKDELDLIPARIDESNRGKKEAINDDETNQRIAELNIAIKTIDEQIENSTKSIQAEIDNSNQIRKQKFELESKLNGLINGQMNEKQNSLNVFNIELRKNQSFIESNNSQIKNHQFTINKNTQEIESLNIEQTKLRSEIFAIKESEFVFDEKQCICPTCKRQLENADEKKNELNENFNQNKVDKTFKLNNKGIANKARILALDDENKSLNESINKIQIENKNIEITISGIKNQKTIIENSLSVYTKTDEIIELENQIKSIVIPEIVQPDNTILKAQKSQLQTEIDSLKSLLQINQHNAIIEKRIAELESQQKTMNTQIAKLERSEFVAEKFQKVKIEEIEKRINGKFNHVKWKMFEIQLNGGERETCECTLDGVPFSSLNTEGRINAGLDIINALCQHFDVVAPIFIDDRSIVSEIFPTKSQIINLINIPGQKYLSIN
jgi:exonuclease SbcC